MDEISKEKGKKLIFGITGNPNKEEIKKTVSLLESLLNEKESIFSEELSPFLSGNRRILPLEKMAEHCDFLITLGGDGTFLRTARHSQGKPVIGVNLGGLGFLTVFRPEEIEGVIKDVKNNEYEIEERFAIKAIKGDKHLLALNDITFILTGSSRMINIEVNVNDELLYKFRGDGLIISTPTGSTAYNLAAGGPILYPHMEVIAVTPICPHKLSVRPVILPSDVTLRVQVSSKGEEMLLTADGQENVNLSQNETIQIVPADEKIKIVKTKRTPPYFSILRNKLSWG